MKPAGKQAKKKPAKAKRRPATRRQAPSADLPFEPLPLPDAGTTDDFSLHALFQRQTMAMLDRADLDEEQKQNILVAMNCPCCGGSGMSFTMKLKRKK